MFYLKSFILIQSYQSIRTLADWLPDGFRRRTEDISTEYRTKLAYVGILLESVIRKILIFQKCWNFLSKSEIPQSSDH